MSGEPEDDTTPPYALSRDGKSGWVRDEKRDFNVMAGVVAIGLVVAVACIAAIVFALL